MSDTVQFLSAGPVPVIVFIILIGLFILIIPLFILGIIGSCVHKAGVFLDFCARIYSADGIWEFCEFPGVSHPA